jgi:hypothetical protein
MENYCDWCHQDDCETPAMQSIALSKLLKEPMPQKRFARQYAYSGS